MVGSSKILTVSYGTFSCTLEGFDDSFSTMKAIAEYFRDLAADDRYFGAEPPTPDAEMLARIAEREVARRVEAHSEPTGIVLKAGSALAAVETAEGVAARAAEADAQPVEEVAEPAAEAEPEVEAASEDFVSEGLADPDTAAEDTEAVEDEAAAPVMPPVAEAPARPAPMQFDAAPSVADADYAQDDSADDVADADEAVEAEDDAPEVETFEDVAEAIEPAPAPEADSVAAKLQRIRAVVSRTRAVEPAQAVETGGDQPASLFAEPQHEAASDDDNILGDAAVAEDFAEAFAATEDPSVDTDVADIVSDAEVEAEQDAAASVADVIADLSDADDTVDAELDEALSEAADDLVDEDTVAESPEPVRARVIRMRRSDVVPSAAVEAAEDVAEAAEVDAEDAVEEPVEAAEAPELDADTITDQVFEDLGLATDDPTLEEVAELAQLDGVETPEAASSLSADAEADLQAELAALAGGDSASDDPFATDVTDHEDVAEDLAAELDATEELVAEAEEATQETVEETLEDGEGDTDATEASEETSARPRRVRMPGSIDEDDAAMTRIMSETEAKMSAPETSRRHEAIAQLKAAVAATEAERTEGEAPEGDDSTGEQFRDDLRQVVRPTRPIRPSRPSRPEEQRTDRPASAPLKLVASQRVDETARPAVSEPVTPRRVTSQPIEAAPVAADGSDFSGFVAEMGADQLDDLLEAAAAYTSFVEGSEDFSRPQLMAKVKEHAGDAYSREDGLRAFGTLLRQGRINKVRKGRFQVTDDTRFNPARRAS